MAFLTSEEVCKRSEEFVMRLEDGTIKKFLLRNHGPEFKGAHEELHLDRFIRYIGSASYLMMKCREGQYYGKKYYGI